MTGDERMKKLSYDNLLLALKEKYNEADFQATIDLGYEAVDRNRLNLEANYLLAQALYKEEKWLESYTYYSILYNLQEQYQEYVIEQESLLAVIDKTSKHAVEYMNTLPENARDIYKEKLFEVNSNDHNLLQTIFTVEDNMPDFFGLHTFSGKKYFIGRYDDWSGTFRKPECNQNGITAKSEIYEVDYVGTEYEVKGSFPCVCPVIYNTNTRENEITITQQNGKSTKYVGYGINTYVYLRIEQPCVICSKHEMVFAKPVILRHQQGNKRLVLNLFLDSFNWKFIKERSFKELMPNTYGFFENGIICNRFYTGSEFTYPSVASYFTGCSSTTHQVLNQNVQFPIPEKLDMLSEIFHDYGYYVSIIGGDDAVIPSYGYCRGVDRTLYEKSEQNFYTENVVHEVIEQLEAYGEADQFIWADIQDLHKVAGYWPPRMSVQSRLNPECTQVDNMGGSGLYQTPSPNRRKVYEQQLKYIDFQLGRLYSYIKERYKEDEIIVTLISDHGNGFNVDAGQPFMSEQRINVPLMIHCNENYEHICNEKIENIDYGHILCKLANIQNDRILHNEGQLPHFFGGKREKEYIFSQSLFPDREYEAVIIGDDFWFCFQSIQKIENDCRIDLTGSENILMNHDNCVIKNKELENKCIQIIMEHLGDFLKA